MDFSLCFRLSIFASQYELDQPLHNEKLFDCWLYNGGSVALSGVWKIDAADGNVDLVAKWIDGGCAGNC